VSILPQFWWKLCVLGLNCVGNLLIWCVLLYLNHRKEKEDGLAIKIIVSEVGFVILGTILRMEDSWIEGNSKYQ